MRQSSCSMRRDFQNPAMYACPVTSRKARANPGNATSLSVETVKSHREYTRIIQFHSSKACGDSELWLLGECLKADREFVDEET